MSLRHLAVSLSKQQDKTKNEKGFILTCAGTYVEIISRVAQSKPA
jgi:hypothetical protein